MVTAFTQAALQVQVLGNLHAPDIARATGVAPSTARAWLARTRSPGRGQAAERLIELYALVERLAKVMDPGFIPVWLRMPVPALGDRKPLDAIRDGDYPKVSRLVAALESPTAS
jgi:hypothetical protein